MEGLGAVKEEFMLLNISLSFAYEAFLFTYFGGFYMYFGKGDMNPYIPLLFGLFDVHFLSCLKMFSLGSVGDF